MHQLKRYKYGYYKLLVEEKPSNGHHGASGLRGPP